MQEGSICQQWSFVFLNMHVSYGVKKKNKVLTDYIQVLQNKAAKLVLDRETHSSSTQALLDLNWMNLSTGRLTQWCFLCKIY